MAAIIDHHSITVSPNSSEEVESHHGTPATKLSPFSPDVVGEGLKLKPGAGICRSNVPPAFLLARGQSNFTLIGQVSSSASLGPQDPFITVPNLTGTTQVPTNASKLSPAASTFTPATLLGTASSNTVFASSMAPMSTPAFRDGGPGMGVTVPPFIVSTSQNEVSSQQHALPGPPVTLPKNLKLASLLVCPNANGPRFKLGQFSLEGGTSRCLMVSQLGGTPSAKEADDFFNQNKYPSRIQMVINNSSIVGKVYVKFADIRDTDMALLKVRTTDRKWNVQHLSSVEFAVKSDPDNFNPSPVSMYEGQVLVKAVFNGHPAQFDVEGIGHLIHELLGKEGDVMACEVSVVMPTVASYRAEFYDLRTTEKALADLDGIKLVMCTLSVSIYEPDLARNTTHPLGSSGPLMINREIGLEDTLGNMSLINHRGNGPETPRTPSYSPFAFPTPSTGPFPFRKYPSGLYTPSSLNGYTYGFQGPHLDQSPGWSPTYNSFSDFGLPSPVWSTFNPGAIGQERGTPLAPRTRSGQSSQQQRGQNQMMGARRPPEHASGHHNVVDIERIRQGSDVRTTIMLRNIPNKIDQAMLKEIVDETSFGKYDFMYLRIDFANNCNVGYAFINFEDPYHIIDFVTARAGNRWNRYNSDKVAEVSYATIQGRDCLVQKFRNSSVMLEHVSFRPKIFHTNGLMVGAEDKFPGPDNPSKMRRSVENAEHVGLFAPRAGQSFRDEQRRRRSQYDRGTRLAEIEDSYEGENHGYRDQPNAFHAGGPYGGFNPSYYPGLPGFGSPM